MTVVVSNSTPTRPYRLSAEWRHYFDSLKSTVRQEGSTGFSIAKPLEAGVKTVLDDRLRDLDRWLTSQSGYQAVQEPINFMLGVMRLQNIDEQDAGLIAKAYYISMSDLPLWAVKDACLMALRGGVGDQSGRWAPQPGELHKAAERLLAALWRERGELQKLSLAVVRTPPSQTQEERSAIVKRILGMTREVVEASAMDSGSQA